MVAWGALGLVLGAWVGALARLWMRLIVVHPDAFSWTGTLVIIISAALGGLGLGLVRGARLTGRSRLWRIASLLALPFLGAPMGLGVFLVSALVGGWALARRRPTRLAPAAATLWLVALPFIGYAVGDPGHQGQYDGVHYLSISVGLWTIAALLAVGGRELFLPWSPGGRAHGQVEGVPLPTPDVLGTA